MSYIEYCGSRAIGYSGIISYTQIILQQYQDLIVHKTL